MREDVARIIERCRRRVRVAASMLLFLDANRSRTATNTDTTYRYSLETFQERYTGNSEMARFLARAPRWQREPLRRVCLSYAYDFPGE